MEHKEWDPYYKVHEILYSCRGSSWYGQQRQSRIDRRRCVCLAFGERRKRGNANRSHSGATTASFIPTRTRGTPAAVEGHCGFKTPTRISHRRTSTSDRRKPKI